MAGVSRPARARLAAALALACVTIGCGGTDPATEEAPSGSATLTVYASLPVTGPSREPAQDVLDAIKLALLEARGQAGAFRVNFVGLNAAAPRSDAAWDHDQVLDNARRAVTDRNAIAYLGELDSAASAITLPLLNEAGVLQVSPTNTYAGLTRVEGARRGEPERFYPSGTRTYGRVVPADHAQAAALVSYMAAVGVERLYVADDRGLSGHGLADLVVLAAREGGLEVVAEAAIDPRREDPRALARDVADSRADAFLFAGGAEAGAAALYRAVHAADPALKLFGGDRVAEPALARRLDPAVAADLHLTSPGSGPGRQGPAARRFAARFRDRFGRAPAPAALYGYEAMQVVLQAIADAGPQGNDREAVIERFFAIRDRDSVVGRYSIDENGDTSLAGYAGQRIRRGRLVFDRPLPVPG